MRNHGLAGVAWWLACLFPAGASLCAGEEPLTTIRVASGLNKPVYATHAPNDFDRIFIVEQAGRIKILSGGTLLETPFLEIIKKVRSGGEQGLLGLAFHPSYPDNGFFYVDYTNKSGDTVIARYRVSDKSDIADPDSGVVVLTLRQPQPSHNGGWIAFGPDGYLYVATGDGGHWFDPDRRAQDITDELLGKVLRLDVDRDDWPGDEGRNYGVPPDNPFVGKAGDDEIWAYGLRNPWRCAFDSATGDLYVTDVGQDAWEEVNFQRADDPGGANYGWVCFEGPDCTAFGGDDCDCSSLTSIQPIHAYGGAGSPGVCSIIGGEVYRGCAVPDLQGTYFFADFCSNQIWSLRYDGIKKPTVIDRTSELAPGGALDIRYISSFGRDAFGELYICDWTDGELFKIVPRTAASPGSIVGSDPPHGAIDARQPSEPDGTSPAGWQVIEFVFDGCVANVGRDDFVVTREDGKGLVPTIADVRTVSADTVRVTLSDVIEVGAWTILTHKPSGTLRRIGWLPVDVNADRFSGLADVLVLIGAVNGGGARLPLWSKDIDRSGLVAPGDLLRAIDLLNGAGVYGVARGGQLP
jgi:glucose/arabinose dehydrogenase